MKGWREVGYNTVSLGRAHWGPFFPVHPQVKSSRALLSTQTSHASPLVRNLKNLQKEKWPPYQACTPMETSFQTVQLTE